VIPRVPVRAQAGISPDNDQPAPAAAAPQSKCLRFKVVLITAPRVVSDCRDALSEDAMRAETKLRSSRQMLRMQSRSVIEQETPRKRRRSKQEDAVTDVQWTSIRDRSDLRRANTQPGRRSSRRGCKPGDRGQERL